MGSLAGLTGPSQSLRPHLLDEAMRIQEEGKAQGPFEMLFVFADIFSCRFSWPLSQREPVPQSVNLSGASPCPANKRKVKCPSELGGGQVAKEAFSQRLGGASYLWAPDTLRGCHSVDYK